MFLGIFLQFLQNGISKTKHMLIEWHLILIVDLSFSVSMLFRELVDSLSTSTNQHSQFLFVLRDKTADRLFLMIDLTVEDNFDKMFENSNIQVKVPLKTQVKFCLKFTISQFV